MGFAHTFCAFPDEELGSIVIRAWREVGLSPSLFSHWYLKFPKQESMPRIGNVLVPLARVTNLSPRELLSAHSLAPYGTAGLDPATARRTMIDLTCGRTLRRSPPLGRITRRWCEACVRCDLAKYGIAYWHRCHLLPGVTTCCWHGNPLLRQPESLVSAPIHRCVTHWIGQMLPDQLVGSVLRFPAAPTLQHEISRWSAKALGSQRGLPQANLSLGEIHAVFGPALMRYAIGSNCHYPELPATTARVLAIVAQRYMEQPKRSRQIEIIF